MLFLCVLSVLRGGNALSRMSNILLTSTKYRTFCALHFTF